MRDKIKTKWNELKEWEKDQIEDVLSIRSEMFDRHPFLPGTIEGMCACYIYFVIIVYVARIVFHKELTWTNVKKK